MGRLRTDTQFTSVGCYAVLLCLVGGAVPGHEGAPQAKLVDLLDHAGSALGVNRHNR